MPEFAMMIEGKEGLTWPRWQTMRQLREDLDGLPDLAKILLKTGAANRSSLPNRF